jgi:aminodeoxychorismate lyase
MLVFLNNKFLPGSKALISVFDRGFLYGDALFEAFLVTRGQPVFWSEHLQRLQEGLRVLQLTLPYTPDQLHAFALELIRRNRSPESILRLTLSRGQAPRGYSPRGAARPTLVLSLHPAPVVDPVKPARWRAITTTIRLSANDPLSRFKTANKLPHILARGEADAAGADEAIFLNTAGHLVETTSGNLFWVKKNVVHTPPLSAGPLPGITRRLILELCQKLKIPARQTLAKPRALLQADAVFLTLTSRGVVELISLDGQKLPHSPLPRRLQTAYQERLAAAHG